MKTIKKMIIALVLLGCSLSVEELNAMKKRKLVLPNNNQQNSRPNNQTHEELDIATQCEIISRGVQSKNMTQELFKDAVLNIAVALKKLKTEKVALCIYIKNVIKAFCEYLLASIERVHDKQSKLEELGIQLIGEEKNEEGILDNEKNDREEMNRDQEEPYFLGNYANFSNIFDLLQKLFDSLFDGIQEQATQELLNTVAEKRQELVRERLNNQLVHEEVKQKREHLEETIQNVHDLKEELDLQIQNIQEDTREKQLLATRYQNLNQRALQDKQQLNQILNGEEVDENN